MPKSFIKVYNLILNKKKLSSVIKTRFYSVAITTINLGNINYRRIIIFTFNVSAKISHVFIS